MGGLAEVTRLFEELAVAIRRPVNGGENEEVAGTAASSLVEFLRPNPEAASGTRVLDAALSLMCYRAREVALFFVLFFLF